MNKAEIIEAIERLVTEQAEALRGELTAWEATDYAARNQKMRELFELLQREDKRKR